MLLEEEAAVGKLICSPTRSAVSPLGPLSRSLSRPPSRQALTCLVASSASRPSRLPSQIGQTLTIESSVQDSGAVLYKDRHSVFSPRSPCPDTSLSPQSRPAPPSLFSARSGFNSAGVFVFVTDRNGGDGDSQLDDIVLSVAQSSFSRPRSSSSCSLSESTKGPRCFPLLFFFFFFVLTATLTRKRASRSQSVPRPSPPSCGGICSVLLADKRLRFRGASSSSSHPYMSSSVLSLGSGAGADAGAFLVDTNSVSSFSTFAKKLRMLEFGRWRTAGPATGGRLFGAGRGRSLVLESGAMGTSEA